MPFDPTPIQPAVEVGPYQADADAMLRGCAFTGFTTGHMGCRALGGGLNTCALGARRVGLYGTAYPPSWGYEDQVREERLVEAYRARYGVEIVTDNDDKRFTREQIASRVAALR